MYRRLVSLAVCGMLISTLFAQQTDPVSGLAVTEVFWKSAHPGSDATTGLGGNANGDWYELTNFGTEPINLGGYLMDDDDQLFDNDFAILPAIEIQPNESIIVVQENNANRADGFRDAWGLPSDFRLLSECTSLGGDTFSGLSSGGDQLNIYTPDAVDAEGNLNIPLVDPIIQIDLPAAVTGQSLAWDSDGNFLDFSVSGGTPITGAYPALHDGSETDPPFSALDTASPGYVEGLDVAPASGVQPTLERLFPDEPHVNCPVEVASCDADGDGDCDLDDLDALYAANGSAGPELDIDGSGTVDQDDIDDWLTEASDSDNPAKADPSHIYIVGDLNLSGFVDSSDLGLLLNNFGGANANYGGGDLNLDLIVDSSDLGLLLNNFGGGTPAAAAAAVPEPSSMWMLGLALLGLGFGSRREGKRPRRGL